MIVNSQQDREKIYDYICNLIYDKRSTKEVKYVEYKKIRDYENVDIKIKDFIQSIFKKLKFEDSENNPTHNLIFSNFNENSKKIDDFLQELDNFFIQEYKYNNSKNIFQNKIKEKELTAKDKKHKPLIDDIKKVIYNKYTHIYEKIRDEFGEKLTKDNNYHICPYCNRNYINVVVRKEDKSKNIEEKVVKPDLDHFYPKSIYPFLGATISNLIPSCLSCNQRIKGDIDFFENKHFYPPNELFYNLEFKAIPHLNKIYIDNLDEKKIEEFNSVETFLIQETYATHTEILTLINEKHKKYTESKIDDLAKNVSGLNNTDIKKIVFYEYQDENIDKQKEPLWKLKRDLYKLIVLKK